MQKPKWEYRHLLAEKPEEELNQLGAEGWEIAAAALQPANSVWNLILKREVRPVSMPSASAGKDRRGTGGRFV